MLTRAFLNKRLASGPSLKTFTKSNVRTFVVMNKYASQTGVRAITSGAKVDLNNYKSLNSVPLRFFSDLPPHVKLQMPSLSPTMEKGNLAKWCKKEGDQVEPGDILAEVETDKATVDFEMQEDGYVAKLLVEEGAQDIALGELVAILVEDEDDIAAFKDYKPESSSNAPQKTPKAPEPATPTSEPAKTPKPTPAPKASSKPITQPKKSSPAQAFVSSAPASLNYEDIPLTQVRKIIASRLSESKETIPHYYVTVDAEVDRLLELRSMLNNHSESKISVNDMIIKASSLASKKVPQANSSWQGDYIRQYTNVDVSVAVSTEGGLITPIIREANSKGLETISAEMKDLAARARENKLKPEEFQGGTFSVSNLGMFGVAHFSAIINPPQACILAVGGSQQRVLPTEEEGEYRTANVISFTLSSDHRVVDGAEAAIWGQHFKKYIETPELMLL
ncbi:unnamed protein product [Moneuplotes crassus]|uniref:Dihydrolipoamide acetyltransferase component of pyruvate dehydrogenase complex n=1 Tax=Euplotes crassus TaxID=5936 RepID=A0AAD1XC28_EUPCR|nr:unnamed protein product [Moneuplotes crassus]